MGILRVLLAISVLAAHFGAIWKLKPVSGSIAVETFFIISGFYMSFILNEKYTKKNKSYRLFITNRLLRIYPVYWGTLLATIAFCFIVYWVSNGQDFPIFDYYFSVTPNGYSFPFLILTNLLVFGQDLVMFLGIFPETGGLFFTTNFWKTYPPLYRFLFIEQAWSLGLELLFYLLAPFILRSKLAWVILVILLSLILRIYLYDFVGLRKDPWTYRFFPTEIIFFLFGYISYKIYRRIEQQDLPAYIGRVVLVFCILTTIAYGYVPQVKQWQIPFSWNEILYFLTITAAIPVLFKCFKNNKTDRQVGDLSYPIYLSHFLIGRVIYMLPIFVLKQSWCILIITILFSYLLHTLIQAPIEKYRQSRVKKNN